MSIAAIVLSVVALYAAAGVVVGILFVLFGVSTALPHPLPVSAGARILILPGSILLWPFVLGRWLQSRSRR